MNGFKLQMQKIGPGIFFAYFGAAIMTVALTKPLTFNQIPSVPASPLPNVPSKAPFGNSRSYNDKLEPEAPRNAKVRITSAFSDIIQQAESRQYPDPADLTKTAQFHAQLQIIRSHRDALIVDLFDPEKMRWFREISQQIPSRPNTLEKLTPEELALFEEIRALMNG